jgi:hypothetical protein
MNILKYLWEGIRFMLKMLGVITLFTAMLTFPLWPFLLALLFNSESSWWLLLYIPELILLGYLVKNDLI